MKLPTILAVALATAVFQADAGQAAHGMIGPGALAEVLLVIILAQHAEDHRAVAVDLQRRRGAPFGRSGQDPG